LPTTDIETDPIINSNVNSCLYDVHTFCEKFSNSKQPIILSINIQSLNAKYNNLCDFINQLSCKNVNVDIIALQETWQIKYSNLVCIPGYQQLCFKNRRAGRGGGVGFYIRNGLDFKVLDTPFDSFTDRLFESISLVISDNSNAKCKQYIVTSLYRSPTAINNVTQANQMDTFFNTFDQLTNFLRSRKLCSFICMDSNINLLELNSQFSFTFLNNIIANGFIPINLKATRAQNQSISLIDQIVVNEPDKCCNSGSIIDDLSDHWFTFVQLNFCKKKCKTDQQKSRLITNANLVQFRESLSNLHWNDVTLSNNVDDCYKLFWDPFKSLYDLHFPMVTKRFNRNFHKINAFMTQGLIVSRRTKINLLKISLNDPSNENKLKYKTYRNLYNKLVRVRKKDFFHERLNKSQRNPKKMWEILNELTGKKLSKSGTKIEKICSAGETITGSLNIANEFNKFFCSVGEKISNSVENTTAKPEDYLRPNPNTNPLEFGVFTQAEFINIINSMEPKSSADINGLSNKILKFVKFEISKPLVHLFNLSLTTGKFPSELKCSKTVPIFKAGDNSMCDNYRPISLLSSLSKVLEKAVANRLMSHLRDNQLLYEGQFGFQPGVSTVHHLLKLTNFVAEELNKKNFTVGILLDLKKAFDVVPHKILLKKLENLGIAGVSLRWFASYLEGRTQCVEIDGKISEVLNLAISILQGSILGPILFLCYINDLPNCTELLALMFADDTIGLTSGPELHPLLNKANLELQKLGMWFRANKMAVNVSKTKFIIFKPKGKKITLNPNEGIFFNNNDLNSPNDPNKIYKLDRIYDDNPVSQDRTYKLLGVLIDEHLSFNQHCTYIGNKIAQSNYIIARSKNLLPSKMLKTLYYSLVHPHLLYCLPIYSCTSAKNLKKLLVMQKKAIRSICNSSYNQHTAPLFLDLKIMPLNELISFSQSLLMHSIIYNYGPPIFANQWITNNARNQNILLRNADDIYVPIVTSEQVNKLPLIAFAKLWNSLPDNKYHANPKLFKVLLKEHIWSTLADPV
jgi:Reverse transcriptase (RNA-dependent DNA polymerase)